MCLFDTEMQPEWRQTWENSREESPELHKGVFDIIVPPDFHINPMMTPKILVC